MMESRVRLLSARGRRYAREHPRCDLPVPANPAVLPLAEAGIIQRQVFEQLNPAGQPYARVRSFDQVVAQQKLAGKAVAENGLERVQVVNRLAVEHPFAKEILLGIGNGVAIWIGPAGIGKNPGKAGGRSAWERDTDTRLNDGESSPPMSRDRSITTRFSG
jgi:hypothetical protein